MGSPDIYISGVHTRGKYQGNGYAREFVEGVLDFSKNGEFSLVKLITKNPSFL